MTRRVSDPEYRAVITLSGPERYSHFVRRVADCEEVWSLRSAAGWVQMEDDAGQKLFPVWPHERYAQGFAVDDWAGNTPESIDLEAWMERWLPGMERDGLQIAVFPVTGEGDQGVAISPQRLRSDLEQALEQFE